jgi:archaemetzincin
MESLYGLKTQILQILPIQSLGVTTRMHAQTQQRQALTSDILQLLKATLPKDGYCLLAVTMIDLNPKPDWNLLSGQASLKERVGVYSLARYKPAFRGTAVPAAAQILMLRRKSQIN